MKILHVHSLHLHEPWMRTVAAWASSVDAITIAGNCLPVVSHRRRDDDENDLRRWFASLDAEVYFSRGPHDAADMADWGFDHIHLNGTFNQKGWAIHVMDTYSIELRLPKASPLPGIVVSHFGPLGSGCAIDTPSGENSGRGDIRMMIEHLGDVRLVLCGRVNQPRVRMDWAEGAVVVCPGISRQEHGSEPAFLRADLDARSLQFWDGNRLSAGSFTRGCG